MNSPSKSDQEKYVSEQKSSLLRQIRLLIIFYKINTLLSVKRGPRAAFVIKIKKMEIFDEDFVGFIAFHIF